MMGQGDSPTVTISATGRMKDRGTLQLHVATGLPESDVEVLLVLEPPRNNAQALPPPSG